MGVKNFILRCARVVGVLGLIAGVAQSVTAQDQWKSIPITNATIVVIEGTGAQIQRAGAPAPVPAKTGDVLQIGDRLVMPTNCRAALKPPNPVVMRVSGELEIQAPDPATGRSVLRFFRGILHKFHRGPPGNDELEIRGRRA